MVLRYYDRTVDERPCLDYYVRGGFCIALMVNEDGTTQEVKYDDLEYDKSRRIGEPNIDASEEVIERFAESDYSERPPEIPPKDTRA